MGLTTVPMVRVAAGWRLLRYDVSLRKAGSETSADATQDAETRLALRGLTRLTAATQSLGILGFIIGTAAGQCNIAAGIGYYGAAISIYERWIKRGREVTLSRDTRLVLQTRPRCSLSPALPWLLPAEPLNA
jgi:hypothetical protein